MLHLQSQTGYFERRYSSVLEMQTDYELKWHSCGYGSRVANKYIVLSYISLLWEGNKITMLRFVFVWWLIIHCLTLYYVIYC